MKSKPILARTMLKLLAVGPIPPPITGQSFAFLYIIKEYANVRYVVNTTTSGGKVLRIYQYISSFLISLYYALFGSYDALYYTGSRSTAGLLRDTATIILSSLRNKRTINHLHGADLDDFYNKSGIINRAFIKVQAANTDLLIILLRQMVASTLCYRARNLEVLPNFYDPILESGEIIQPRTKDCRTLRLVYFSNLMASKGFYLLCEVVETLLAENYDIELKIAGTIIGYSDRERQDTLHRLNRITQISECTYMGVVSGKSKIDLLYWADCYILPSFYKSEALPISAIESMRASCSMILTNHNYLPAFANGTGTIFISARDKKSLSEAILQYYNDRSLLYRHQALNRSIAEKSYSPATHITEFNRIINSV